MDKINIYKDITIDSVLAKELTTAQSRTLTITVAGEHVGMLKTVINTKAAIKVPVQITYTDTKQDKPIAITTRAQITAAHTPATPGSIQIPKHLEKVIDEADAWLKTANFYNTVCINKPLLEELARKLDFDSSLFNSQTLAAVFVPVSIKLQTLKLFEQFNRAKADERVYTEYVVKVRRKLNRLAQGQAKYDSTQLLKYKALLFTKVSLAFLRKTNLETPDWSGDIDVKLETAILALDKLVLS